MEKSKKALGATSATEADQERSYDSCACIMSRLAPISQKKYVKFLKHVGCTYSRQKDDHKIYHKNGILRPIVFADEKEIPRDVIKSNLRTLKISTTEYLRMIQKL